MVYTWMIPFTVFYCVMLAAHSLIFRKRPTSDSTPVPTTKYVEAQPLKPLEVTQVQAPQLPISNPNSNESLHRLFESLEKWGDDRMDDKMGDSGEKVKLETAHILCKLKGAVSEQKSQQQIKLRQSIEACKEETGHKLRKLRETMNAKMSEQLGTLQKEINSDQLETMQRLSKMQHIINAQANQQLSALVALQQAINVDKEDSIRKLKRLQQTIQEETSQRLDTFQVQQAIDAEKQVTTQEMMRLQTASSINEEETAKKLSKLRDTINRQNSQHLSTLLAITEQKKKYLNTIHAINAGVVDADQRLKKLEGRGQKHKGKMSESVQKRLKQALKCQKLINYY